MALEKEYLTFEELKKRWNLSDDEIHYLITNESLTPSIAWDRYAFDCEWEFITADFDYALLIAKDENGKFVKERRKWGWVYLQIPTPTGAYSYDFLYASHTLRPERDETAKGWCQLCDYDEHFNLEIPNINQRYVQNSAVFMKLAISYCEARHPELLKVNNPVTLPATDQVIALDKDSPTYPPELDIALKAWEAVSTTEGKGKPKARIRKWLDDNHSTLSNEAKDRIAIVANWDKTGGATST